MNVKQQKQMMTEKRLVCLAPALLFFLFTSPCNSKELDAVDWGGYIIVPDVGEEEHVTFDVRRLDDEAGPKYKITMIHNDQDYLFENLDIKVNEITFKLDTGSLYDCSLILREDGSYSGDCDRSNSNDSKKKIFITMTPQAQDESSGDME